jgi:tRNA A37 threonylcarbamoyladenosine biosynthesis protein TsaE
VIEWPEKVLDLLPAHHHEVKMMFGASDNEREIVIQEIHGVAA